MWDLQTGEIVGKFESYARPLSGQLEPCTCHRYSPCDSANWFNTQLGLCLYTPKPQHMPLAAAREMSSFTQQIPRRLANIEPPSQPAAPGLGSAVAMYVQRVSVIVRKLDCSSHSKTEPRWEEDSNGVGNRPDFHF